MSLSAHAAVAGSPPSIFTPVGEPAATIRNITWLLLGITGAIFVAVEGFLVYTIFRFRRRREGDGREPPQTYGSNPIEVAWTVLPLLIVLVLFLVTARTVVSTEDKVPPAHDVAVTVIGHQWWWEFRYPKLGVTTANELHVPVSTARHPESVYLTLESADVIHSFWVPQLAGKTDVIPNRINHMWFEPRRVGTYLGQCAEYCGTEHANMLLRVVVEPRAKFERWVAEQRRPAVRDEAVAAGRRVFLSNGCVNCHAIRGTPANGTFAPDLTHLMSRTTIGAGAAANTPENLRRWVRDPASIKPGVHMPAMQLSRSQVGQVVAYLETLR